LFSNLTIWEGVGQWLTGNALRQGTVIDLALLLALIVVAGSILTLLGRQAEALRTLKSA